MTSSVHLAVLIRSVTVEVLVAVSGRWTVQNRSTLICSCSCQRSAELLLTVEPLMDLCWSSLLLSVGPVSGSTRTLLPEPTCDCDSEIQTSPHDNIHSSVTVWNQSAAALSAALSGDNRPFIDEKTINKESVCKNTLGLDRSSEHFEWLMEIGWVWMGKITHNKESNSQ